MVFGRKKPEDVRRMDDINKQLLELKERERSLQSMRPDPQPPQRFVPQTFVQEQKPQEVKEDININQIYLDFLFNCSRLLELEKQLRTGRITERDERNYSRTEDDILRECRTLQVIIGLLKNDLLNSGAFTEKDIDNLMANIKSGKASYNYLVG